MAPSVSKEELMRNSDHLVWGLSATNSSPENEPQRFCERIWVFLNSRTCNIVIVFLVIVEGLVNLSELLISLDVIRDPNWKPALTTNVTQNYTLFLPTVYSHSPKLKTASSVLSCISIIILTCFFIEILLRLLSGRFRYIVQGIEIFDAMVVVVAFSLDLALLTSQNKGSAREASVLLILLRLWRLRGVLHSITDAAKVEMGYVINAYQREKFQAEHKVDILILKVEDLEHEVAYLKEKLKKTEKESIVIKKRRSKEGSLGSHSKSSSATVAVETLPPALCPSTGTQTLEEDQLFTAIQGISNGVHIFAEKMASTVLLEVFHMFQHCREPQYLMPSITTTITTVTLTETPKTKPGNKLRRRPDGSLESGYGSGASNINWDRIRAHIRSDQKHQQSIVSPGGHLGLKCPESSPESGYMSSVSALHPRTNSASPVDTDLSSGSAKHADTVFLFPDPQGGGAKIQDVAEVELEWLDEQSEIERVKRVEFDPNQRDTAVPMTSL